MNSAETSNPPPLPDVRRWSIAWYFIVIGGPLLALCCPFVFQTKNSENFFNVVAVVLVLSLILHLIASIRLAQAQAALKQLAGLPAGLGGLIFYLLFLGWGIMLGVFFAGCTIAMSVATAMQ